MKIGDKFITLCKDSNINGIFDKGIILTYFRDSEDFLYFIDSNGREISYYKNPDCLDNKIENFIEPLQTSK